MSRAENTGQAPASPAPRSADTSTPRRPLKTKVCSFWKQGTCLHGTQCRFAHGTPEQAEGGRAAVLPGLASLVLSGEPAEDDASSSASTVPTEGRSFRGNGRFMKSKVGVAVLCGKPLADGVVSRFRMNDEHTFPCAFPCNDTVCRGDHIYPERYGVGKGTETDALVSVPLKALGALALDENDPKIMIRAAQVCLPMRRLFCCCRPYRCLPACPFPPSE
jgi:hypothetical protein